jgi:SAM-dependent methyltransferase
MNHADDPYSRLNYRRLISWPARIEREAPFLKRLFGEDGTGRHLVDLGCGTGEHSAYLSSLGFELTGIDRSASNIATAKEEHPGVLFHEGDITGVDSFLPGLVNGALCLGNTLPHLLEVGDVEKLFSALSRKLLPGGVFVLQILNYTKIFEKRERILPTNLRPDGGDGEILFLRLMDPRPDGTVIFNPCTLRYRPGVEPPLEVVTAKNVLLRGWKDDQLVPLLEKSGLSAVERFGGMQGEEYQPLISNDLVLVARR